MANLPVINVKMPDSAINKALNAVFLVAAAGGTYFLVNKVVQKAKRDNALSQYGANTPDGLASLFATQFYSAFYSTWEWISDYAGDGTDEDLCYRTAGEMYRNRISLQAVSQKYRALYQKDLLQDLQRELDAEELAAFNRMLSSGLAGLGAATQQLVTIAPTYILNDQLQPVATANQRMILGEFEPHNLNAYVLANGRTVIGFMYNSHMRYVDSASVKLI